MSSINEGYKQTKVGVIPEEWEVVRLGDIAFRIIKKNTDNSIQKVFSNSAINGIVMQNEYFDKDIANKDNLTGYYVVEYGDFVYNPRISKYAPAGPINQNIYLFSGIVSPLYTVFRIKNKEIVDFLKYFFNSTLWLRYMQSVANYGARHDRMNITNSDFMKMPIPLPPLKEQQKIAQILTTWDEAISKQEALIAEKEQLKKGLMQKLLSGEVRFEGFDGEWEEVRLKKVVKCLDNKRIPLNKQERQTMQGDIPYYGSTSIVDYVNDYIFDEDLVLVSEDGGYFYEYETRPIAFYITGKSWVNNHVHIIKNINESLDLKFLYYSLVHKNITAFLNGGTRAKLNKKDLLLLKIKLPSLKEQQKIAQVLTIADKEIELLKKELEALKEQKRGLMQKLLTGEVRVKIDEGIKNG